MPIVAVSILLLSLLYLLQVTIARGYQGPLLSLQLFIRAMLEWSGWAILLPPIFWLANRFPVGPGQPSRNITIIVAAAALAMPAWAVLVAAPLTLFDLPLWSNRAATGFLAAAKTGLLQRGAYLVIVYGLIVGLATARRLVGERQAAAIRTAEARRALAAADLARFTSVMGSDKLVERLDEVERAMAQSGDAAEASTLALADDLHRALVQSRDMLRE